MADLQTTLGAVVRRARRERGLTRRALADRSAVSEVYLGEVERGEKYPSARVLEQVAAALDLETPDLLAQVAEALRAAATRVPAIGFVRRDHEPEARAAGRPRTPEARNAPRLTLLPRPVAPLSDEAALPALPNGVLRLVRPGAALWLPPARAAK